MIFYGMLALLFMTRLMLGNSDTTDVDEDPTAPEPEATFASDDTLVGTAGADDLNGFGGNDLIQRLESDDTLAGDDSRAGYGREGGGGPPPWR